MPDCFSYFLSCKFHFIKYQVIHFHHVIRANNHLVTTSYQGYKLMAKVEDKLIFDISHKNRDYSDLNISFKKQKIMITTIDNNNF